MFDQTEWMNKYETKIMLLLMEALDTNEFSDKLDDLIGDVENLCSLGCHGISKADGEEGFVISMEDGRVYKVIVSEVKR